MPTYDEIMNNMRPVDESNNNAQIEQEGKEKLERLKRRFEELKNEYNEYKIKLKGEIKNG